MNDSLLNVNDLIIRFSTDSGTVHAVNGVSLDIRPGEVLGVVGESGSGKSVTAKAILNLLPRRSARIERGEILFEGVDLLALTDTELRRIRGRKISMIFQDPTSALNPVLTIGHQLDEVLKEHTEMSSVERRRRSIELLEMVEISSAADRLSQYPHEFSGGMRQRIMIAMALACGPQLLIADEPTTALDVTTQLQILDLLETLRRELQMAIMMITHDVGVVARMADRVAVMYAGTVLEMGDVETILEHPQHPYTEALTQAVPSIEKDRAHTLRTIPGRPPSMLQPLSRCPFFERCAYRSDERCAREIPPLVEVAEGHLVASFCHVRADVA
ncbi:MAG TPA: ABC transporter ATP-binding protein [Acidimicrobiia bacterium]